MNAAALMVQNIVEKVVNDLDTEIPQRVLDAQASGGNTGRRVKSRVGYAPTKNDAVLTDDDSNDDEEMTAADLSIRKTARELMFLFKAAGAAYGTLQDDVTRRRYEFIVDGLLLENTTEETNKNNINEKDWLNNNG